MFQGHLFELPTDFNAGNMYYNTSLFAKAGLACQPWRDRVDSGLGDRRCHYRGTGYLGAQHLSSDTHRLVQPAAQMDTHRPLVVQLQQRLPTGADGTVHPQQHYCYRLHRHRSDYYLDNEWLRLRYGVFPWPGG
jgi:hypothetical protein